MNGRFDVWIYEWMDGYFVRYIDLIFRDTHINI